MKTQSDDTEAAIRTLRRRHPLLDAWLDAMDRLEAPHWRKVTVRNPRFQRRPLLPSVERHPVGRRRPPHPVVVQPGPIRP
jgi:hypothetical protein